MAAASAAPSRYSRLGRDKLGEGAYGLVYPAWDSQEERVVAIKQQRRDSAEAGREMLIYDGLPRHPNLLCLLDKFVLEPHLNITSRCWPPCCAHCARHLRPVTIRNTTSRGEIMDPDLK